MPIQRYSLYLDLEVKSQDSRGGDRAGRRGKKEGDVRMDVRKEEVMGEIQWNCEREREEIIPGTQEIPLPSLLFFHPLFHTHTLSFFHCLSTPLVVAVLETAREHSVLEE